MTHLSDTLNALNKNSYSTRKIAELANKAGHEINYSTVSRYLAGKHPNPPKREIIAALADALGVSIATLERAGGLAESRTPFHLPASAAVLTDAERAAVLNLVEVMVASKDALAPSPAIEDFHPEQAGYSLAANHDDEARARMDWLDSLGEESQDS